MQKQKNKAIITAALTGAIHTPTMSPHLPITPQQLIDEILAVHEAGGAVAHLHVRDPKDGCPNADQDIFREIATEVKKHCDIILCTTTGGRLGEPVEKRVQVVSTLKPELASLNAGSLNFALFHVADKYKDWKYEWEKQYLEGTEDLIFPNTFKTMRQFLSIFREMETKPEFEIYDVGMINNLAFLIEAGYVQRPVYLQFVLGVLGGIPPAPENLMFMLETARKAIGDFEFSACVAGKAQFPLCTQSLIMGGHARVGLEDNLYLEKGVMAKSNAEQVAKIIRIARELGIEPATPREARGVLGLKGLDKVNF
ncbi:MAG: 3-keto-5-aminohexanoate cleavage protein [Deltaproteobacteria bacterium]|nr:3-keto-5-aminohexanoate cleavage protein [Deltaproteobacteria bacterium]MBW2113033.1 3-keto-5-aminohexanoate cleavage protein [Deltaproteobacteria bacterium]MBW2354749.1 3-keto-5-aminohexanoate cleavage protein [Deltaproteobacteria bacterium]HDZ23969.1 3-keto-5-aminohexanoate cleavage protein [Desulfobacteraceae bacterium]